MIIATIENALTFLVVGGLGVLAFFFLVYFLQTIAGFAGPSYDDVDDQPRLGRFGWLKVLANGYFHVFSPVAPYLSGIGWITALHLSLIHI